MLIEKRGERGERKGTAFLTSKGSERQQNAARGEKKNTLRSGFGKRKNSNRLVGEKKKDFLNLRKILHDGGAYL